MIRILRWIAWPWAGLREAKGELAQSQADQPAVRELADDIRRINRENHITARVHAAMRGGGS